MVMKHRNNHFAVGYWTQIRQGRAAPDQADIDPKALKRLLPFVFLLDMRADGSFTYRLAGTALCERYGGELRGKDFFGHWDEMSRASLRKVLRQALARRAPACLTSIGSTEDCRMIEIETVLLPITYGAGEPQRFLGVTQLLTDVGSFSSKHIEFERLIAAKLISEGDMAASDDDAPTPPPSAVVERWSRSKTPHLRLVVSRSDIPQATDPLRMEATDLMEKIASLWGQQPKLRRVE
jgi:hypothetical protein